MSSTNESTNEETQTHNVVIVPPDGGWGWFVAFVSFLSIGFVDGVIYSFSIYYEVLTKEFDVGVTKVAVIGSIVFGVTLCIGPLVSALLNIFDFRVVAFLGSILGAASYALSSFCRGYYEFAIVYGVGLGISLGMIFVPSIVIPNLYFVKRRPLAGAITFCGTGIGTIAFPHLITFLLQCFYWRNVFRLFISVTILIGFATLSYKPLTPLEQNSKKYIKDLKKDGLNQVSCGCYCCVYNNKNYPTIAEVVSVKDAEFVKQPTFTKEERRQSIELTSTQKMSNQEIRCYNYRYYLRCKCFEHEFRPFYRDDIFYFSSIRLLSQYKGENKQWSSLTKEEAYEQMKAYNMNVTRVTMEKEFVETTRCDCNCSFKFLRTFITLLHLQFVKSLAFNLLSCGSFFYTISIVISYLFIKERAEFIGIGDDISCWLISTIGVANMIGRLFCGILTSFSKVNCITLTCFLTLLSGIFPIISNLCKEVWYQFTWVGCFGFFSASYISLRPVIITEIFGLENLSNIFGLQMVVCGIAALIGSTIAGYMNDVTKSYDCAFYLTGVSIILSSLVLIITKKVRKWEMKKEMTRST